MSEMRHWQVCGSMPPITRPGHSYNWRENVTAHVIAASARRAVELVEAKHLGIDIHSVNHKGAVSIIDDSATA